jgi:hypothetical protein
VGDEGRDQYIDRAAQRNEASLLADED